MGLPVHQIFATLEEQMQILDEEPAGDPEEELDDEGEGADDLSEMKVKLVEGDHGVNWLVWTVSTFSTKTVNLSAHTCFVSSNVFKNINDP